MKTVYVLFMTDVWKTKKSRLFYGIFSTKDKAIDQAKENGLYTNTSEVEILECEVNKFEEQ